jgi:cytochrome P450
MTTTEHGVGSAGGVEAIPEIEYNLFKIEPVMAHTSHMDELRERTHAFWNSSPPGFWSLTRMENVREALQHPELFSSRSVIPIEPDPPYQWIPEMLDPPEHTRWRQLLAPLFTPTVIAKMEDKVRSRAVEIIEPLVGRGRCDFLRDFAWRYPTTIFMELMGLPVEEADKFLEWEGEILHLPLDADPDRARAVKAMVEVQDYFAALIQQRKADPRDDLLSTAIGWKIDGEPIPDSEFLAFCLLMFMAGLDTVSIQLSYSWYHLATHPEDRARIVREPEVIPAAIEEFLRVYSFVPTGRRITRDVEFSGCPMKAGQMVSVWIPAACRDPRAFPDADKFDMDREVNNHIAFGAGPHRCLGSHLARRELRAAMEEWHTRIPDYRLAEDVPVMEHGGMFGIDSLALVWDA